MKSLVPALLLVGALSPLRLFGQAGQAAALNEWHPSKAVPGMFYMPLLGEETRPGPYVYRVRAPNGLRIPPNWHTQTMHQTVLSGTLVMVMGEPLDTSRAQRYSAGSFLVTPAGMRHLEWFEGETVVHVETQGPIERVYVNPADDPRKPAQP